MIKGVLQRLRHFWICIVALTAAAAMGIGGMAPAQATELRNAADDNAQQALQYLDTLNDARQKQRNVLPSKNVAEAEQADNGINMSAEDIADADVSGKPVARLNVNSDLTDWAQARAHALAISPDSGADTFPSHDDMYVGAPQWASEKAKNLEQSPDYKDGHIFGPEAIYLGAVPTKSNDNAQDQSASKSTDPASVWQQELSATDATQRHGYDPYLTSMNRYANIAGIACEAVANGPQAGAQLCVLEVGFDTGEGTTMSVAEAQKQALPAQEKYEVKFDANGGKGTMPAQTLERNKPGDLSVNTFTREGYTFDGWSEAQNGVGNAKHYKDAEQVVNLAEPGQSVTLYAQWKVVPQKDKAQQPRNGQAQQEKPTPQDNQYYVSFDANGGTFTIDGETTSYQSVYVAEGECVSKPKAPIRKGYTFKGWTTSFYVNDNSDLNTVAFYDFNKPVTKDLSLYAIWVGNPYTIVYDANGGTGFMFPQKTRVGQRKIYDSSSSTYTDGTYLRPNNYKSIGKHFLAWNTKANGSGTMLEEGPAVPDLTQTADATVTLYAQWISGTPTSIDPVNITCTISYSDDDPSCNDVPETVKVHYSDGHVLNSKVSWNIKDYDYKTHYHNGEHVAFYGHAVATSLLTATANAFITDTKPPVLHGVEDTAVKVGNSFDPMQGVTADDHIDGNITQSIAITQTVDTSSPGSYSLRYTATNSRGVQNSEDRRVIVSDEPLVRVHFEANGGTGTMDDQMFAKNWSEALHTATFTRKPANLDSWNTKPDGTGISYNIYSSSFSTSTDTTLYAQWGGTIYYRLNAGNSYDGNSKHVQWNHIQVDETPITRPGYSFESWNTKLDGSGTRYLPGQPINGYSGEFNNAFIDLYAQWVPNSYSVHFDANGGSGTMPDQTLTYNQATNLNAFNFIAPEGRYFTGWNSKPDGSGTDYGDMHTVKNLVEQGTMTLYAQYSTSIISSIMVQTPATKQQYTVGQALNTAGLEVVGITKDANVKALQMNEYSLSTPNMYQSGEQKITVTLKSDPSKTAWFSIYVGVAKPTVSVSSKVENTNIVPANYVVDLDTSTSSELFDKAVSGARAQRAFILMQYPQINVFFVQAQTPTFATDFARWASTNGVTVDGVAVIADDSLTKEAIRHSDVSPSEVATVKHPWSQTGPDISPTQTGADPDTNLDAAWGIDAIGAGRAQEARVPLRPTMVGVLDTGIAINHPELKDRVDPDLSVSCAANGVPQQGTDAEGHYVWEPASGELSANSDSTHGTHVSGTIAATHNGSGVDGVSPTSRLASIKVIPGDSGTWDMTVCGYMWAGEAHLDVTNASIGNSSPVFPDSDAASYNEITALQRAINFAAQQGVVNVAAAGNEGYDLDNATNSPSVRSFLPPDTHKVLPLQSTVSSTGNYSEKASNEAKAASGKGMFMPAMLDNIVTVSAVQKVSYLSSQELSRAKVNRIGGMETDYCRFGGWCSNYGAKTIDVAAPGVDIDSSIVTLNSDKHSYKFDYGGMSGTSMASPHVAGVAALIKAIHPDFTPAQTVALMKKQAKELYNHLDAPTDGAEYRGAGLVNAYAAVTEDQPQPKVAVEFSMDNGSTWSKLSESAIPGKAIIRLTATGPVTKASLSVPGHDTASQTADGSFSGNVQLQVPVDYSNLTSPEKVSLKVDAYGRNASDDADDDVHQTISFTSGQAPITPTSVDSVALQTIQGSTPTLPTTVTVHYSDSSTANKAVTWQHIDWASQNIGTVAVQGSVADIPTMPVYAYVTVQPKPKAPISRLSGNLRYDTMGKVVDEAFPGRSDYAVVASGGNYPDALAASSLAGALNAPVLLTDSKSLSSQTASRLRRLRPSHVIIIGGASAVSNAVRSRIETTVPGTQVTRIYGQLRYDTANQIFTQGRNALGVSWSKTAIVTTGDSFADALSISPYAYAKHAPIFLTATGKGLDSASLQSIRSQGFTKVIIMGGTRAVSNNVTNQLYAAGIFDVQRLQGDTRYQTSLSAAQFASQDGTLGFSQPVFATGSNFPDALAGSALAGKRKSVLVLVDPNYSRNALNWIGTYHGRDVAQAWILGGTNAISRSTSYLISDSLGIRWE